MTSHVPECSGTEQESIAASLNTGGRRLRNGNTSFFARDPMPGDADVRFLPGWKDDGEGGAGLDEEAACFPGQADEFVTVYQKIATTSDESLAALKQKFAAPVRPVLYQDLESTIWTIWQVRPADVTVNHIGHALDLLVRKSEGGVELDRLSCEACGVDYAGLMSLIRRSRVNGDEVAARLKVPRQSASAPALTSDPASADAPSPAGEPDPAPGCETDEANAPAARKKPGRPAQISVASKEAALAAREQNGSWKDVARILYDVKYPKPQQVKNSFTILKYYERTRVARPNNS